MAETIFFQTIAFLIKRGVASANLVTTDFNPLKTSNKVT